MRTPLILHLVYIVMGKKVIKLIPRRHPDYRVSILRDTSRMEWSVVRMVDTAKEKNMKRSSETKFEIDNGMTEILQGELRLCKDTKSDKVVVCTSSGDPFSNWEPISDDGSIKFKTEQDFCLEVQENRGDGERLVLVGAKCRPDAKNQLFNISDVEEEESDEDNIESGRDMDQSLENMVSFLLQPTSGSRKPVKQRIILYNGGGKKLASFVGPVNSPVGGLNPGVLPHSDDGVPSPPKSFKTLPGLNNDGDFSIAPSYAGYGRGAY